MRSQFRMLVVCLFWLVLATCSSSDSATAPPSVASVQVSLPSQALYITATLQASVTVSDQTGRAMPGQSVTWSGGDGTKASVSSSGLVTGVGVGTVAIIATVGTHQGSANLSVLQVPVGSVVVTPVSNILFVGQTRQLSAVAIDSIGGTLTNRTVAWASSDATKASVSTTGLVTAVGVGTAVLTATIDGKSATATISVLAVPVARISVTPSSPTLLPWKSVRLAATAFDSAGNALPGRQFTWSSAAPVRASVDGTGLVTANLLGTVTVTASTAGVSGAATVIVEIPSPIMVSANIDLGGGINTGETSITINPKNPLNVVASANWAHYASLDGGRSWSSFSTVAPSAEVDPSVAFDSEGRLFRAGLTLFQSPPRPRQLYVDRSTDGGLTLPFKSVAYDPGTVASGESDQPIMTIDTVSASPYRNSIYVISPDYLAPSPKYVRIGAGLIVLVSRDGGATWSAPIDISDCPNTGQEPSASITTGPNGEVYAAWPSGCNGIQQFMFARSLDGGRTWERNATASVMGPASAFPLTDDVRGNATIDVDRTSGPHRGSIYLTALDNDAADAWMVRSTDGGATWSSRVLLSDGPRGPSRYYFQPHINVAPNGRIDAAWYDTRNWAGADINHVTYDVYYAYSTNGGQSFGPSIRVTDVSSTKNTICPTQQRCGDRAIGDYMALASDSSRAMPVWTDRRTPNPRPYFATIWITP